MLYLGIDSGGTKAAFLLTDESGRVMARHREPGCTALSGRKAGVKRMLENGIAAICRKAQIDKNDIAALGLGICGYGEGEEIAQEVSEACAEAFIPGRYVCAVDTYVGWAGSLLMEPGVNIIAGTGSVVYGAAGDGRTARAGGWGAGCDEGSCSWHGQKLVEAYTKQADGRMPRTALYEIFREHFHITEDEAFVMALNHEVASSRKSLAQLQYLLGRAWAAGDPAADAIYRLGAEELYLGVETVVRKLHLPWDGLRVSYSGGLFKAGECILSPLRERIEARGVELGAQFYMVKPFEPDHLLSHIRELADGSGGLLPMARTPVPVHVQSLDERLGSLFLTIGIPAHIKGYQYLRYGIKMVIEQPDVINRITKELYPSIAKHFGTSASKVERAIRHAIEVAWNRGRVETLNRAFGCRVCTPEDKPTNGEFIAMLADKLSLERSA